MATYTNTNTTQVIMDFTHTFENNPASQIFFDEKRLHFNNKCKVVFNWLMQGREITVLEAANEHVSSLPRRIADLKDKGVLISWKWANGVKVWFMDQDQKAFNKKF